MSRSELDTATPDFYHEAVVSSVRKENQGLVFLAEAITQAPYFAPI
jgi:hypothetical protein